MALVRSKRYSLLQGETVCYVCGAPVRVAAIAAPPEAVVEDDEYPLAAGEHGWLGLSELGDLPVRVLARLEQLAPGFRADDSVTAGFSYLMNHCRCGARLGDFYLHNKPDGPFFGERTEGLKAWVIVEPLTVDASFSEGPLDEWLRRAIDAPSER